jgi:PAS domain S-box-containing protein
MRRISKRYLGFMPVPAFIAIIAVLYLVVKPSLFYEPAWLLPITNTLFVTVVFFLVAYIAMRNYKATGRIQILLLGGGVLAFGIGGVVAGLARGVPGAGANLNVTIYNTGALIGAMFHFAAAFLLLAGVSPEVGSKGKAFWLASSYLGLTVFMALFSIASLKGFIPPFFIQGVGPTTLRQWVLASADILFAFSFFIFMGSYLKNGEGFLYWYSLALALTSISLTAFFIESAVGSPVGWTGRLSQYLGGIYFLTAIMTAIRSAQVRRTSFDNVLTASLSPAEEKFRALAEHSPDIIARFDGEMRHIYVNQAGLRLYGKPAGSIIGKKMEGMTLQESFRSPLEERIQKVFQTGQSVEVEHYLPIENGTRFYQSRCVPEFGVDGAVVNVLVVSHDLTKRKHAEEALRQSEQRWATTLASIGDGVIATDVNGRITFMNAVAEGLTGWALREASQKPVTKVFNVVDEHTRKEVDNPVTKVLQAGNVVGLGNHTILVRKDGIEVAIDDSGAPIKDESGNISGVVLVFRDITERKQAEEALRRAHDELEKRVQERTSDLSEAIERLRIENTQRKELEDILREKENQVRFFASQCLTAQEMERKRVAGELHDSIAAALAAMKFRIDKTAVEMKQGPGGLESLQDLGSMVSEINNEVRRIMADLRPSILDDLGIIPAVDWFCREYQKTYSHISVEKQIGVSEHEMPDSLKTPIFRISQEAMNNIAKYSKAGLVNLALRKEDDKILLTIQDNGQGFDLKTTKRGLGLSTMRERAELSGGSFDLESTIGKGTLIRVSWPV